MNRLTRSSDWFNLVLVYFLNSCFFSIFVYEFLLRCSKEINVANKFFDVSVMLLNKLPFTIIPITGLFYLFS